MVDDDAPVGNADGGTAGASARRKWIIGISAVVIVAIVIWLIAAFATRPTPGAGESDSPSGAVPSASSTEPGASPGATPDASDPADPTDAVTFPELPPVAPEVPGEAPGIQVTLNTFESVTGEVVVPGEVEAAAVRITAQITNTGEVPIDLNLFVMNAYMGEERDPAETYQQPGGVPVSGSLDPGASATGVYLFRIPEDRRSDVTIVADYQGGLPAITWRGAIPAT